MRVAFTKCHGSGNDFAMIDARGGLPDAEAVAAMAVALSDRAGSVGSDGILFLTAGDGEHAFGMRMFNADGSEAETCLNGLRCVARAGLEATGLGAARVRLVSSSAEVARVADMAAGVATIRERAGPADLDIRRWPFDIGAERLVETVCDALPTRRALTAVAMPNPHLVAFVDGVDDAELAALGAWCEARPAVLPHRANVSFVVQEGPQRLFVRTCERGVGLTDACGSAMAAAVFAAGLTGRIGFGREVTVANAGGRVLASADAGGMVTIAGNATYEWAGAVDIDLDARRAGPVAVTARFADEIAAWDAVRRGG